MLEKLLIALNDEARVSLLLDLCGYDKETGAFSDVDDAAVLLGVMPEDARNMCLRLLPIPLQAQHAHTRTRAHDSPFPLCV